MTATIDESKLQALCEKNIRDDLRRPGGIRIDGDPWRIYSDGCGALSVPDDPSHPLPESAVFAPLAALLSDCRTTHAATVEELKVFLAPVVEREGRDLPHVSIFGAVFDAVLVIKFIEPVSGACRVRPSDGKTPMALFGEGWRILLMPMLVYAREAMNLPSFGGRKP